MSRIEPNIITGPIPLPDVQRVFLDQQWSDYEYPEYIEQKYPTADQFVTWRFVGVVEELGQEILKRAIDALLIHHDGLRVRLVKQDGKWTQYIVPPDEMTPLVWMDFSTVSKEMQQEMIQSTIQRELHSLNLAHGPIIKCLYMKLGEEEPDLLFLIFNHVIIDGISAQIFRDDLCAALTQLHSGQEIVLPPKSTSIKTWEERVEACLHSEEWGAEIERLIAYKRSWASPSLRTLPLDYPGEKRDEKNADWRMVSLSQQETATLLKQATIVWKVRFLDLLQTALVKTIAPWAGVSSLPICTLTHGRDWVFEDIDLSRTIGSFAMGLLEVLECKEGMHPQLSPLSDSRLLFAQVLLNFSRSLEMAYEADGKEKYVSFYDRYNPQVTINFQRDVDYIDKPGQKSLFQSFKGTLSDLSTRVPSKSLDYLISIDQGQLQISLNFSPRYFKYSTIERLAESYLKELRAFIYL